MSKRLPTIELVPHRQAARSDLDAPQGEAPIASRWMTLVLLTLAMLPLAIVLLARHDAEAERIKRIQAEEQADQLAHQVDALHAARMQREAAQ